MWGQSRVFQEVAFGEAGWMADALLEVPGLDGEREPASVPAAGQRMGRGEERNATKADCCGKL